MATDNLFQAYLRNQYIEIQKTVKIQSYIYPDINIINSFFPPSFKRRLYITSFPEKFYEIHFIMNYVYKEVEY